MLAGIGTTVSGGGSCTYGQTVSFSGVAQSGYTWNGWTDDNTATSRSTTCDGNKTFTTKAASRATYTYEKAGANGWYGTYTCTNGNATITSCRYSGQYGSDVCTGSDTNTPTFPCTLKTTDSEQLIYCNLSFYKVSGMYWSAFGGGLSSSESC